MAGPWEAVSVVRWLRDYKKTDLIEGLKMLTAKAKPLASLAIYSHVFDEHAAVSLKKHKYMSMITPVLA